MRSPGRRFLIRLEILLFLVDSFNLFLNDKSVYCSDKTRLYYENCLHVFSNYLDSLGITETEEIDTNILKSFAIYLRNKSIKNTSINTYFRALKNYCNWGICNGSMIPFDYKIKLPRPDPDQILPLSSGEVKNIIDYIRSYSSCPDLRELFFRLLLDCGMRSSEVLNITRKDFDLDKGIILINHSKYDKSRMIPLPDRVRSLIPDQEGKLFPFGESGKQSFFCRMRKQTGIQRVHAHLLRHTFATSYMVNIGNLEFLRMYLGHSSYSVTQNYIKASYQCKLLKYDIYKIDDVFT